MAARNMIARKTVRGKVSSQQDRALITLHVLLIRVFQLQRVILEGDDSFVVPSRFPVYTQYCTSCSSYLIEIQSGT